MITKAVYIVENLFGTINNGELAYYSPRALIVILEGEMGNSFDDIKNFVKNASVNITSEQIVEFLNTTFEQENPELKKRIDNRNKSPKSSEILFGKEQIEHIINSRQKFIDDIEASRYAFTPYSLEYFKKYIAILKTKTLLLLSIIEAISNKKSDLISEQLSDLDINLDNDDDILKEDIIRLILPTIFNLNELKEKVTKANNVATYLEFKESREFIYKRGFSEGELYPPISIQINSLDGNYNQGNVPLSENQKDILREKRKKSMQKTAKFIIDLWD